MIINVLSMFILICVAGSFIYSTVMGDKITCGENVINEQTLSFNDTENEIIYDYTVPRKRMNDVKRRYDQSLSKYKVAGDTLGLTLGTYSYNLNVVSGYGRTNLWQDKYCPNIKSINIDFNYDSKIYVAREETRNKCAFDIIVKHELDHHQVNITNKQKYLGWLKRDLPTVLNEVLKKHNKPIPKANLQSSIDQIKHDINDVISTYIDRMQMDTKKENQKLDTRSEYTRLNALIRKCYK